MKKHHKTEIVHGTPGNDVILTNGGIKVIYAGNGNDIIHTNGGVKIVYAGNGDDLISDQNASGKGHSEDTFVFAGAGNDSMASVAGHDVLYMGAGDDLVYAHGGSDIISYGGRGHDTLNLPIAWRHDVKQEQAGGFTIYSFDGHTVMAKGFEEVFFSVRDYSF